MAQVVKERALQRLRKRLANVTLSVGLQDYQRKAVLNTFDEWALRELGRIWREEKP